MTKDEIMQALRMTAMSRINTPIQEQFCQKLEELFAGWVAPISAKAVEAAAASLMAADAKQHSMAVKQTKKAKAD